MEKNKDTIDGIPIHTPIQKQNQKVIQSFFNKYKKYELSKECKNIIENNKDIFSEEPVEPSLSLFKNNEIINKNECFYKADKNIKNYFPLVHFKLNISNNKINNNNNKIIIEKEKKYNLNNSNLNATTIKGGKEIKDIISDPNTSWVLIESGREQISHSSFELFEYLTKYILPNKKLDDYTIKMYNNNNSLYFPEYQATYKGGELYINLMKYLPLYYKKNNINVNTAEFYNANNNNLNDINNDEYDQETNTNNYLVEQYNMNPNNDTDFGFNNNS